MGLLWTPMRSGNYWFEKPCNGYDANQTVKRDHDRRDLFFAAQLQPTCLLGLVSIRQMRNWVPSVNSRLRRSLQDG